MLVIDFDFRFSSLLTLSCIRYSDLPLISANKYVKFMYGFKMAALNEFSLREKSVT